MTYPFTQTQRNEIQRILENRLGKIANSPFPEYIKVQKIDKELNLIVAELKNQLIAKSIKGNTKVNLLFE